VINRTTAVAAGGSSSGRHSGTPARRAKHRRMVLGLGTNGQPATDSPGGRLTDDPETIVTHQPAPRHTITLALAPAGGAL
jgi:hypothetical protein